MTQLGAGARARQSAGAPGTWDARLLGKVRPFCFHPKKIAALFFLKMGGFIGDFGPVLVALCGGVLVGYSQGLELSDDIGYVRRKWEVDW